MGVGITAGLALAAMTLTTLARKNVVDGVATFRMQPGSYDRVRNRLHDGLLRTVRLGHGPSRGASSRSRAAKEDSGSVSSMAAAHRLTGEGHWLVTGILLSLRPTPEATQAKARQRIVGNTLGGIAAALVLLTHPGPWAVTATVAATSTLAYALRPANYLYWCLAFPLLLLLLADFDRPTPWYTAAVRAGLVLVGAVVASRRLWPPTQTLGSAN